VNYPPPEDKKSPQALIKAIEIKFSLSTELCIFTALFDAFKLITS
jgi:hypothetical protein